MKRNDFGFPVLDDDDLPGIPTFNEWLQWVRNTHDVHDIVDLVEIDEDELVELCNHHLFALYKEMQTPYDEEDLRIIDEDEL